MKKILFCASTVSHIKNFHLPYLKAFHDMGYKVHVVTNESIPIQWADKVFRLSFQKKLYSPKNLLAGFQAYKLIKANGYEKISTNTTLASVIMRLAALFVKDRPFIFNIVHGYLFNRDSGIKKYIYLIPEKIVAKVSDVVMVMNHEDFEIAQRYKLYKGQLFYINGMGVNPLRFKPVSLREKSKRKTIMGFKSNDFLFVYAAEFSKRKNQQFLIDAFIKCKLKNAHLLLAGDGKTIGTCKEYVEKLGQKNNIHFLGYVDDVPNLYSACDAAVSTSLIEGLPFNIIEAMGSGLPVAASKIKGHCELVEQNVNGMLFEKQNELELMNCLKEMYQCADEQREQYGLAGIDKSKAFLLDSVFEQVMEIYKLNDSD